MRKNTTKNMVLCGLFAALTAVGAFIHIPLGTMSLTLQFFFTAMAGVLLGPFWGAVSQLVYVVIGLFGIPVFTQGGGIGYVFQPSFGFLLGLIPAAAVIGWLTKNRVYFKRIIPASVAGLAVLYLIGLPYMAMVLNLYMGKNMSFSQIITGGMLVYLPGDALKIAAVVVLAPRINKAVYIENRS